MRLVSVTVVLSAFLLFLVQPLIGKVVLPWFGGAPAVWTTCLLFFQLVLLGGYAWSHLVVKRLSSNAQKTAHVSLLGISALSVVVTAVRWGTPLIPDLSMRPTGAESPMLSLGWLLLSSVGLPYFTLSSTGPLLQAWVSRQLPAASAMRLYSVSNVGSLVGLLAFPIALEPVWPLRTLAWAWAGGFLVFVALCAAVTISAPPLEREQVRASVDASSEAAQVTPKPGHDAQSSPPGPGRDTSRHAPAAPSIGAVPLAQSVRWVLLAAAPSALLLATTNHLTQDVAPIPFLWVLPLVLYLASFVVTFDSDRWYRRAWAVPALIATGLWVGGLLLFPTEPSASIALSGHLSFLSIACLCAHGELVALRPRGEHLTSFYLSVSAGGALGGLLVALLAPLLLRDFYELPLIAAWLVLHVCLEVARSDGRAWVRRATLAFAALLAVIFGWSIQSKGIAVVERRRNFFGVLRVERDARGPVLMHGRVLHGAQCADPAKARTPTTYYSPSTGIGLTLRARTQPLSVGVIGLGIGTLGGYAKPGDSFRFYEINPDVIALASGEGGFFTFLSGAPTRPALVLGDARTSLEREAPNAFDVLVVDAFSGDSVPTHLLTREAFQLYLRHLASPKSVLALHVSNQYLDLIPVVARLALELHLHAVVVNVESTEDWASTSQWALLSFDAAALEVDARPGQVVALTAQQAGPLWTDEFTSLWGLVEW